MPPLPQNVLASILTSPGEAEPFLTRVQRTIASGRADAHPVADIFSNAVWGTIRWDRSVGWPSASRMADGFNLKFNYLEIVDDGETQSGNVTGTGTLKPGASPLLWDGPHDEENFRVSFLYFAIKSSMQQVALELRNGVAWHPLWLTPARYIEYPPSLQATLGFFQRKVDAAVFLDEFVVRNSFDTRPTWDGTHPNP